LELVRIFSVNDRVYPLALACAPLHRKRQTALRMVSDSENAACSLVSCSCLYSLLTKLLCLQ